MNKGFGNSSQKKILKDTRYIQFYNYERYAKEFLRNKNIQKAKKIFLNLINSGFKSYETFYSLGIIEIKEKNYKEAINFLLKAKSLSKENNFKLLFTLVNSFLAINEFDEARAELDKALIKNPKSELLIFNYAKVEEDLLNFKKAINLYEKGLKIDPNSYKALSNLGRLYQKNHNYPSAIKVFKKAIYLRPDLSHLKLSLLSAKHFPVIGLNLNMIMIF